ncbi:hypothetical protein ACFQHV_20610 [Promicromonospora thailandica]|uniref:Uncharacterized protein n=1 Tax=Promicromonospora thailandica TaxID=765201 RepID=A0A9X2G902_9MICO|nr:hypothetical protein [Promicromonospora thailandica]MCP2264171.1 hypothetical protein [Promicromonospora thailandica]
MIDQHASERDENPAGDAADANGAPTETLGHLTGATGTASEDGEAAHHPAPGAFANVAVADYVRDAIAAIALLVSLALPWNLTDRSADRVEVVLAVAVSLASLSLPYLARLAVLPVSWTVHTTRRTRLLAGLPLAVIGLLHLIFDVRSGTGVGTGLGLALAGAALAATPRDSELGPVEQDGGVLRGWRLGLAGVGALIALGAVLSTLFAELADGATLGDRLLSPVWLVLVLGLTWLLVGGTVRHDRPSRLVLVAAGFVLALLFVFTSGDGLTGLESMRPGVTDPSRFGLVLLPLAAAFAGAPAVRRDPEAEEDLDTERAAGVWVRVAIRAFDVIVLLAACSALAALVQLIDPGFIGSGAGVTLVVRLVLGVVVGAIAWFARRSLRRDPNTGHVPAVGAACVAGVLGLVVVIATSGASLGVNLGDLLMALGLPIVAASALMVPKAVREHFQTVGIGGDGDVDRTAAYVWAPPRPKADKAAPATLPEEPVRSAPELRRPAEPRRVSSTGAVRTVAGAAAAQRGATPVQAAAPESGEVSITSMRTVEDMPAAAAGETATMPPVRPETSGQPAARPVSGASPVASAAAQPAGQPTGQPAAAQPGARVQRVASGQATARIRPVTGQQAAAADPGADQGHVTRPVVVGRVQQPDETARQGHTAVMPPVGGRWTAAVALDPATPLADLAKIVQEAPHLRPQVAANPSTYPALLDWLGALGDPQVDAALRTRR